MADFDDEEGNRKREECSRMGKEEETWEEMTLEVEEEVVHEPAEKARGASVLLLAVVPTMRTCAYGSLGLER